MYKCLYMLAEKLLIYSNFSFQSFENKIFTLLNRTFWRMFYFILASQQTDKIKGRKSWRNPESVSVLKMITVLSDIGMIFCWRFSSLCLSTCAFSFSQPCHSHWGQNLVSCEVPLYRVTVTSVTVATGTLTAHRDSSVVTVSLGVFCDVQQKTYCHKHALNNKTMNKT